MSSSKLSIGILGAGKLSVVLSQLAVKAGYEVSVSNSKDPKELTLSFSILSPGTKVVTRDTLVASSDIVILAMPLSKYRSIPASTLNGKIVIDAMNYWWEVDGALETIHPLSTSSSEQVQLYFSGARIIKAFNHIGYHDLYDHASSPNNPMRRAVAIAGDAKEDVATVSRVVNDLGFDPLIIDKLKLGRLLEPGSNVFGASIPITELRQLLAIE